jgi:cytoskeletal protein RodZ
MESIGDTLREARRGKRASLEDAARSTKIKLDILEKLEADEFDRLAAPMYTKGFLKLYADYLGLDSQQIVDAYLESQGGLRRTGLQIETEKVAQARKPPEVKLPLRSVVMVVAVVTVAAVVILFARTLWTRRAHQPAQVAHPTSQVTATAPAAPPKADFEAIYQPRTMPAPELLDASAGK